MLFSQFNNHFCFSLASAVSVTVVRTGITQGVRFEIVPPQGLLNAVTVKVYYISCNAGIPMMTFSLVSVL